MKIFITHIPDQSDIAAVLKKWLESGFGDGCQVILSGEPETLPAAALDLEPDGEPLAEIKAVLILCSPASLRMPWVAFEAGCAWIRRKFIAPVCCSGLALKDLPAPLASFSGFDLDQKDFPQKLFFSIARELGVSQMPAIHYRQMREELRAAHGSPAPAASGGEPKTAVEHIDTVHIQILSVLADGHGYTLPVLSQHFKCNENKMTRLLQTLVEWNYVYVSPPGMGHTKYNITKLGRSRLGQEGSSTERQL
ncbi:MAG TPA: hypothetical protein VLS90_07610 [Thermodesulfobacteriota bacterium]|nr:hypothetical protein [Thermodesulfobacteriota bacterium]